MIAGRLPFLGETMAEITDRILHAEPDALVRPDQVVPPEIDAVARKALQKSPEFRYQSAREIYVDLHQLARRMDTLDTTAQVLRTPSAGFAAVRAEVAQGERLIAIMTFANVTREAADDWIGVDCGVVNIAVDSDGVVYSGRPINGVRRRNDGRNDRRPTAEDADRDLHLVRRGRGRRGNGQSGRRGA